MALARTITRQQLSVIHENTTWPCFPLMKAEILHPLAPHPCSAVLTSPGLLLCHHIDCASHRYAVHPPSPSAVAFRCRPDGSRLCHQQPCRSAARSWCKLGAAHFNASPTQPAPSRFLVPQKKILLPPYTKLTFPALRVPETDTILASSTHRMKSVSP